MATARTADDLNLTNEEIGGRIRAARARAGYRSEATFADALGMAQSTISRIESGKRTVSASELVRIAELLGRPPQHFLQPAEQAKAWFRITEQALPRETAAAVDWLERFSNQIRVLRDFTNNADVPRADRLQLDAPQTIPAAQVAAEDVRRQLGLGSGPAPDMFELVERLGCLIVVRQLGAWGPDALYVPRPLSIALINGDKPGVRQRFTLAHELAHHLFDFASVLVDDDIFGARPEHQDRHTAQRERIAGVFAAHFLMPKGGIESELARRFEKRVPTESAHAFWLAYHFGVSLQAICYQLVNLAMVPETKSQQWMRADQSVLAASLGLLSERQNQSVQLRWPPEFLQRLTVALEHGLINPGDAARHLEGDEEALRAVLAAG